MRKAYAAVTGVAKEKKLDRRTAAYVLAIQQVGRAALARRHVTEKIDFS